MSMISAPQAGPSASDSGGNTPSGAAPSSFRDCEKWVWPCMAALTAVYFFFAFFHLADVPLLDPDEPRYAAAGRNMSEGGSLLVPEFNGQPRINKPPLFYWLVALSDTLTGRAGEVTSRLPSVVMGWLLLMLTVCLGRRVYGPATGMVAGGILLTMPLFMALSRSCIVDMTLSFFMSATLAVLLLGTVKKISPRATLLLGTALLGLAILTKATPALAVALVLILDRVFNMRREDRSRGMRLIVALLLAGCVLSCVSFQFAEQARRKKVAALRAAKLDPENAPAEADGVYPGGAAEARFRKLEKVCSMSALTLALLSVATLVYLGCKAPAGVLTRRHWLSGLLLAVLAGLWWYALLMFQMGPGQFTQFLKEETLNRLTGEMHREPLYYYIPMVFSVAFPWSIGLLAALGRVWTGSQAEDAETAPADRFLAAWLLGIVFFFSIPTAKLATYVMPAMPALALLMARFILRWSQGGVMGWNWKRVTYAQAAIAGACLLAIAFCPGLINAEYRPLIAQLPISLPVFAVTLAAAIMIGWVAVANGWLATGVFCLCGVLPGSILAVFPLTIQSLQNRSSRDLCQQVQSRIADCPRLVCVGETVESLTFYLKRNIQKPRQGESANKPIPAIIEEELGRAEQVALFIKDTHYARQVLHKSAAELDQMTDADLAASLPSNAMFLARDTNLIVIRSRPAAR
jgi:4-amino-4-deoxy-L-arabinose transferase-like glycosyltransferase